jgi:predicted nuclease of predicted toxin-antitoxin system
VRLREPFTFFVDRSLGGHVIVDALRKTGELVEAHDLHFGQDTTDREWLAEVGRQGWVVLTKDARIRTNELERESLLASRVAAFMLGRGDVGGSQMAAAFVLALPRMKKVLRRYKVPLIAAVSVLGAVSVLYAEGERLPSPRLVK